MGIINHRFIYICQTCGRSAIKFGIFGNLIGECKQHGRENMKQVIVGYEGIAIESVI